MRSSILVVDDDKGHLAMLGTVLKDWGHEVRAVEDGEAAVAAIQERPYDVTLMDVRMAGMDGIQALKRIKEYNPAAPVLIMTAYSSVETAVEALKAGAYDYLIKPLDLDVLRHTLERGLDHSRLRAENRQLREQLSRLGSVEIIGTSPRMRELLEMAATVAPTEATVLITGESGTGKELIARAIHAGSGRSGGPLVIVNCAALSENLLESELFGHEKGAFTGADRRREGRFMQAHKGTIFLDEIGEISQSVQVKLLRAIQQREVQRVGGDKPLTVDVRILAATNRDLKAEVEAGQFREDLYYRLNVVTLVAPALRERSEDIPLLAQHFLVLFAERNGKRLTGFTPRAMDALIKAPWRGNVRELENAVERAVILTPGEYVTERELPPGLLAEACIEEDCPTETADLAGQPLEEVERRAVLATLEQTRGNKSEAARILGITRATLHKKLKQYGL